MFIIAYRFIVFHWSIVQLSKSEWRQRLMDLLQKEDWEEKLQEIIEEGQSLQAVLTALEQVLGMGRPRSKASDRGGGDGEEAEAEPALRDRRPALRRAIKPLADKVLNERRPGGNAWLKDDGLKVQRSSSLWTALARAIGCSDGTSVGSLAQRIRSLCPGNAKDDEETRLTQFLTMTGCRAIIYDYEEEKKERSLDLFVEVEEPEAPVGSSNDDLRDVRFVDGSDSEVEVREREDGPPPEELKNRATRCMTLLQNALKPPEPAPKQPQHQPAPPALQPGLRHTTQAARARPVQPPPPPVRLRRAELRLPTTRQAFLGTGGGNIHRIEREFTVRISVPKTNSQPHLPVTVVGEEEDVDAAVASLQRLYFSEIISFQSVPHFQRDVGIPALNKIRRNHRVDTDWKPDISKLVISGEFGAVRKAADEVRSMFLKSKRVQIPSPLLERFRQKKQRELNTTADIREVSSEADGITITGQAGLVQCF
eukprot:Skav232330  [mRNA]  locus=scaffold1704:38770:43038:+ [translate_table: standard]